eukprot:3246259-Amphidinium_carterae.1
MYTTASCGDLEGAGGAEETVGQQTCEYATTQQRQWERNAQGRWQAKVGQVRCGMTKLRTSARKALGKGAGLRRSATVELMAHGGPAADPQVSADLSTVR